MIDRTMTRPTFHGMTFRDGDYEHACVVRVHPDDADVLELVSWHDSLGAAKRVARNLRKLERAT